MNLWNISLKVYCISNLNVTSLRETSAVVYLVQGYTTEELLGLVADKKQVQHSPKTL